MEDEKSSLRRRLLLGDNKERPEKRATVPIASDASSAPNKLKTNTTPLKIREPKEGWAALLQSLKNLVPISSGPPTQLTFNQSDDPTPEQNTTDHHQQQQQQQFAQLSQPSRPNSQEKTEWAFLITGLFLEILSAIVDQLRFPLMGMLLAFVGLMFSVVDLIMKAPKESLAWGKGILLPCCYRHQRPPGTGAAAAFCSKIFGSPVESFGLFSAVWQCFYSVVEYRYACKHLNNPIRFCLLPFFFASCLLMSKLIRSRQQNNI